MWRSHWPVSMPRQGEKSSRPWMQDSAFSAPSGLGIRSRRYAMLVEDGVVKALHVEDTPRNAVESSAERLLADL